MPETPNREQTKMVSFIISPAVRLEMDAARKAPGARVDVIISPQESKSDPSAGVGPAKEALLKFLEGIESANPRSSDFYVFASLLPDEIEILARRADVYQIWNDHKCEAHLLSTVNTIKASACWRTFNARGEGITWAVLDSGIRSGHPHFSRFQTIDSSLQKNFSSSPTLEDRFGHGTHVAGIIAGCPPERSSDACPYRAATYLEDADEPKIEPLASAPSGVAPMAKLVMMTVRDRRRHQSWDWSTFARSTRTAGVFASTESI
jgi:subtilisin family serine protease